MKGLLGVIAACAIGLTVAACETQEAKKSDAKMEKKEAATMLDADALKKAFKSGGSCEWKTASASGEDFYFTTEKQGMGAADRYVGGKQNPGTWAIKGDKLCLNFGKENCTGLTEVGKNTYKAKHVSGAEMEMKC